jgi:SRSO17 transposase
MLVAEWSAATLQWEQEPAALKGQLGAAFGRLEIRQSAHGFIDGLLSGIARKTGWSMAEQAGLARPDRMQSLLGRSVWEADALRDLVGAEVMASLGDPCGVLVVNGCVAKRINGFLKKGEQPVAVARQ